MKERRVGMLVKLCHRTNGNEPASDLFDPGYTEAGRCSCLGAIRAKSRRDEDGQEYACSAEDAAYATFLCDNGARGVQIAEKSIELWAKRYRMDIEPLEGEVV